MADILRVGCSQGAALAGNKRVGLNLRRDCEAGESDWRTLPSFSKDSSLEEEKMNIQLVRATNEYKEQLSEMLTECKNDIIVNQTGMFPWEISADGHVEQRYWMGT